MATYLDAILEFHRERCESDRRDLAHLRERCELLPPAPSLVDSLREHRFGVIAEVKRRSPVRGSMTDGEINPIEVALDYQSGGAAAISVLTDSPHFGGSLDDLSAVAQRVTIPVLRKDFLLNERDLCDARIHGASAALLIAVAMDRENLERLIRFSNSIGIELLLEVHDPEEVADIDLVGLGFRGALGVNQRDLVTFEVNPGRAISLRPHLGDSFPVVAESGVKSAQDARALAGAGYDAILVGETLMRSNDRIGALKALRDL